MQLDLDRQLLADVAVHNPHVAGAVLRLANELADGEPVPGELLCLLGKHLRALGALIGEQADRPMVIEGYQ